MPVGYEAVIAGAGIAGASTAFHLARSGVTEVLLCDPRPPLTLTSDKSTECYRNWWPDTAMVEFMNRSIDLLEAHHEESAGAFNLTRRGYLFVTHDIGRLASMAASATTVSRLAAGDVRLHAGDSAGYTPSPPTGLGGLDNGADVFLTEPAIRQPFPFLPESVAGGIHVRRAGWLSAQQYGAWLIDEAKAAGLQPRHAAVDQVEVGRDGIEAVRVGGDWVRTPRLINAAGPMLNTVASMVGERLPVVNELHLKTAFLDHLDAIPRDAPMVIVNDPQTLAWSDEERALLREAARSELVEEMPPSCHARPEGGPDSEWVLGLWEYGATIMEPHWPIPLDELYTEVVIRGLERAFPRLAEYRDRLPRATVDGGYYTKTPDNQPLIGPMRTKGAYVAGGLSGFGIMAAAAAGELVAAHITGSTLPSYAGAFDVARFDDPDYVQGMSGRDSGQL